MAWKRYQVHVHGYGRKLITRDGPAQGLLEWPAHTWRTISTRPMADAHPHHAVVMLWMDAEKVHDNGKAPELPAGWYPAKAQRAS